MAKRVYEEWKGSNKFIFRGRVIYGPDATSQFITIFLVIVPVVIFCVFIARHLFHEFPTYNAGYAILAVAIFLTIYVLALLVVTSTGDPGIIPRNKKPPEEEFPADSSRSADIGGRRTPSHRIPRSKEIMVDGVLVKVKYCNTCMIYRPPRCSHCSVCNNCIDRFDHHCPWVGQCIGVRNYRYFFMFVSSTAVLCIYVFAMSALYVKTIMKKDKVTVWKAMRESPPAVILMVYTFISLWFVGGLTGFHSYLIATNQSTYENYRNRSENRRNTNSRGCWKNVLEVFCTKTPASRNDFRAFVEEEEEVEAEVVPTARSPVRIEQGESSSGDARSSLQKELVRIQQGESSSGDTRSTLQKELDICTELIRISHQQKKEIDDILCGRSNETVHHHNRPEAADDPPPTVLDSENHPPAIVADVAASASPTIESLDATNLSEGTGWEVISVDDSNVTDEVISDSILREPPNIIDNWIP